LEDAFVASDIVKEAVVLFGICDENVASGATLTFAQERECVVATEFAFVADRADGGVSEGRLDFGIGNTEVLKHTDSVVGNGCMRRRHRCRCGGTVIRR